MASTHTRARLARPPGLLATSEPPLAPRFTAAANRNIRALGRDWQEDLKRLQARELGPEHLLRELIERDPLLSASGWIDYVHTLVNYR